MWLKKYRMNTFYHVSSVKYFHLPVLKYIYSLMEKRILRQKYTKMGSPLHHQFQYLASKFECKIIPTSDPDDH